MVEIIGNISPIWLKIGRVNIVEVVEQIISSNRRINVDQHYSRDGYKLDTAPCLLLRTMSPGCFSWRPLLMPWKFKIPETKSEVSNRY